MAKSKSPAENSRAIPLATDPQRELLQQLTSLSISSAEEEDRLSQTFENDMQQLRERIAAARKANEEKRARNMAAIEEKHADRLARIDARAKQDRENLDKETARAKAAADEEKASIDEQVRKQTEQARWLAESVLEAVETQLEVESRQAKQLQATRNAEIEQEKNTLAALLARLEQDYVPFEPLNGEEITSRLASEPDKVYDENREKVHDDLQRLANLRIPRLVSGGTPYLSAIFICVAAGVLGALVVEDVTDRLIAGTVAVVVAAVASVVTTFQLKRKARSQVVGICVPLNQAIDLMRRSADASFSTGEAKRQEREREERRKCAREVEVAREKAKPFTIQAAEKHARTIQEIAQRYKEAQERLAAQRLQKLQELEEQHKAAIEAAEAAYQHEKQRIDADEQENTARIKRAFDEDSASLMKRWDDGLATISRLLADKDNPPPAPREWDLKQWENWDSPKNFPLSVPFGTLTIDLRSLTTSVPRKLQIPEAFTIPAVLAFPQRGSLLIETDHSGRQQAISIASMVMTRLLTHFPAGRAKFTIIDPVGLGQSFAGFMHLADHDESLVGARIWTENEHIEQRLADLTEHMETVIQKYLRNEYQTIDQYNAQAGELAEPVRFLVIADFPVGFEQESLRRLASIATSGARCGVYTIIIRDTRQQLPSNANYEELVARSIYLRLTGGQTKWIDEVFSRFPLQIDTAPDEKTLTALMDQVGRAARRANRVEVPFDTIAPQPDQFWTASSKDELRVAIGKAGATRLQPLRLGVGVAQHALVAGKTGSGKSNLMHTIVTNLAMWYSPEEVEFYLVDFKKGVEFKSYVTRHLPHARAIAVESDREFGLSVLQRVDAELTRRGDLFRAAGVQEISSYRTQTGKKLPRTLLLIDEFQEFFSEDDKLAQEAAVLLDRLVRQGRAFGVHVVLGSQTIGGASSLPRSTIGQMAVRIALQCSEADSQLILGDNNSAARLLSRPGEAIYNDAGGLVEANSPFQIAFLPDEQRDRYLKAIQECTKKQARLVPPPPVVFEGNAPADILKNTQLAELLAHPAWDRIPHAALGFVGEPVSIKEPTAITFRRQSGANALLIGQQDELALAVMSAVMISLATQYSPDRATFMILDGTPADSQLAGTLQRTAAALPHRARHVAYRDVDATMVELAAELDRRNADPDAPHEAIFVFIYALQRYRSLRKQEDTFSFSATEDETPKPDKIFARLISEGPPLGIHIIGWADTAVTLDRTFDRGIMREFDNRILFQMSSNDSSNLIDSPAANKLGPFRALAYSEEMGTIEKFRPYAPPSDQWLEHVRELLAGAKSSL